MGFRRRQLRQKKVTAGNRGVTRTVTTGSIFHLSKHLQTAVPTYINRDREDRPRRRSRWNDQVFFCCDALLLVQRSAACPLLLEFPLIPLLLANYLTGSLYNLLTLHVRTSLLPGKDPGTSRISSLQCDRDFVFRKRQLRPVDFCALVCARPRQTKHTRRKQSY